MRFVIICVISLLSISAYAQSDFFEREFNQLLNSDEPEQAEALLNQLKEKLPDKKFRNYHKMLGQSFLRNYLYDKSLQHFRLSEQLKSNKHIHYYHKAISTADLSPESILQREVYLRKTKIKELQARYMRTFLNDPDKLNDSFRIYNKIMAVRFREFTYRQRPDRAEKYILNNLEYLNETGKQNICHLLGRAFMKSYKFRNYEKALKYITLSGRKGDYPELMKYELGMELYKNRNYSEAYSQFSEGGYRHLAARMLVILAKEAEKSGDISTANSRYSKALKLYNAILFTVDTPWESEDTWKRVSCINFIKYQNKKNGNNKLLNKILKGAGNYCKTLNNYAIYYFCQEHISELIRYRSIKSARKRIKALSREHKKTRFSRNRKIKVIFDYQILKDKKGVKENRAPAKKKNREEVEEFVRWYPHTIEVRNYFYGPVGLFHPDMQNHYYYSIAEESYDINGCDTWVLDVVPVKPDQMNPVTERKLMYGRVWIDKSDYSTVRISWIPRHNKRSKVFIKLANILEQKSRIDLITDFGFKKGALRYPSSGSYKEYFINNHNSPEEFASLKIDYINYRFFNTATSIEETTLYE